MPTLEPFPEKGCPGVTSFHWTLKHHPKSRRDPFCACSAFSFTPPWKTGAAEMPHVRLNTSLHPLCGSRHPTGCSRANLSFPVLPARHTHPQRNWCPNPALTCHKQGSSGVSPSTVLILILELHDIHTPATFSTSQGSPQPFQSHFVSFWWKLSSALWSRTFTSHAGCIS